jgi:hypothetical protein
MPIDGVPASKTHFLIFDYVEKALRRLFFISPLIARLLFRAFPEEGQAVLPGYF